jgi:formate hydrogenlyase subunit 3/multisubunit Na+/H+ antiporter MnhD subunit
MDFIYLYGAMTAAFALAMTAALVLRSRPAAANWLAHGLSAAGCSLALAGAAFVFSAGPQEFTLPGGTLFGPVAVRADYLSAFFLAVIGAVGAAARFMRWTFGREYFGRRLGQMAGCTRLSCCRCWRWYGSHVVAFHRGWELLTVASYLLGGPRAEKAANCRAAYVFS